MKVSVRPLTVDDLPEADRICRLAFGTFIGLPDPLQFFGDADYVRTRWKADPRAAFAAEVDGQLAGSNFVARWGSFAFFGPVSVRPDLWEKGVARRLLEPTMELFAQWGVRHAGLFTFAQSAKHVHLYQKFGFWPRFLTAVMSKPVGPSRPAASPAKLSEVPEGERDGCLEECRALSDSLYEGLDVAVEIRSVAEQKLGDTLLLREGRNLVGFAVCHCGPGTEAGSGTCFVKFAAVRPGPKAAEQFDQLLSATDSFAAVRGLAKVDAGVNLAREEAYRLMVERGFRTFLQGVAMHRPNEEGFSRRGMYVIDDWR